MVGMRVGKNGLVATLLLFGAVSALIACGGPVVSDIVDNGGNAGGTPTGTDTGRDTPTPTPTPPAGKHHPAGWGAANQHGPAAVFQAEACNTVACHGTTLMGNGAAVGCDGCHVAAGQTTPGAQWRTDCTFCHGTVGVSPTSNTYGAPPRDIDGKTDPATTRFRAHTQHLTDGPDHLAFKCTQCHVVPTNALDAGHWFDTTPGYPELTFTAGLSPAGAYDRNTKTCSSLYCHGKGTGNNGTISNTSAKPICTSCHAMPNNTGKHGTHGGFRCNVCHSATSTAQNTISDPSKHVNGVKEVKFAAGGTYNNGSCSSLVGNCHGTKSW